MQNVKVRKNELLTKVTANRAKHIDEFKTAHEVWVEQTIAAHKQVIKNLKEIGKIGIANFGVEPTSQEDSYNTAIAMLNMSVEDEISLTLQEFKQYVMDEWNWSQSFKSITSNYTSSSVTGGSKRK